METPPLYLNTHDPSIRNMLIQKYDKYGEKYVYDEFGVAGGTVRKWKIRRSQIGSLETGYAASGLRSTLTPQDITKLEKALVKDPFATNAELAAKIKNKISARQVGNVIAKSEHQFSWKLEQVDVEQSFSPEVAKQTHKFFNKIKKIPQDDRIYVDETFASAGIRRRKGRFPKGKKFWSPRNRKYKRMVIVGAITKKGWLHPGKIYHKPSISNEDFEEYVSKTLRPLLAANQTVIWDRYGRSGRAKNPVARHFSPKARADIESTGAKLEILPPSGKYGDPIELVFGDTKRIYDKKMAKKMEKVMPSKIPYAEMSKVWKAAEKKISPDSFIRAFKERANGKEFIRVCKERGLPEK